MVDAYGTEPLAPSCWADLGLLVRVNAACEGKFLRSGGAPTATGRVLLKVASTKDPWIPMVAPHPSRPAWGKCGV